MSYVINHYSFSIAWTIYKAFFIFHLNIDIIIIIIYHLSIDIYKQ